MLATPSCTQTLLLCSVAAPIIKDPAFLARVSSFLCIPDFLCPSPPAPPPSVLWLLFYVFLLFVDKRRRMKVCALLLTSCSSWTFCLFLLTRVSVSDFLPPTPPCFLPSLREGGGPCCSDHFCRLTSGSSTFPVCRQPVELRTAALRFGSALSGSAPSALVDASGLFVLLSAGFLTSHLRLRAGRLRERNSRQPPVSWRVLTVHFDL